MSGDDNDIPETFFTEGVADDDDDAENETSSAASGSSDDANEVEQDMLASIFGQSVDDNRNDKYDQDNGNEGGDEEDFDRKPSAREAAVVESDVNELDRKPSAIATAAGVANDSPETSSPGYTSSTKAMSLPPNVREAGRKARLRLEEEKSKRKEIVRINDKAEALLAEKISSTGGGTKRKKSAGNTLTALSTRSAVAAGKKRKRATKAKAAAKEDYGGIRIDSWMPDTSAVSMEGRSNLVRVHGLPYGCKPEELRRFFTGLSPVRVLVLAPYDRQIDGWDCSDSGTADTSTSASSRKTRKRQRGATPASGSTPRGPFVKRYSSVFRVFVQFESAPSAQLALKRSGESIFTTNAILLDDSNDSDSSSGGIYEATKEQEKKKVGAAVFISPISKAQASFLKKRQVAIDGVKGDPLHETVEAVVVQLPRFVTRTLWALSLINLRISQRRNADKGKDSDCYDTDARKVADAFSILEKRMDTSFPECPDAYRALAIGYNSLCDLYDSIEGKAKLEMTILRQDPTLLEDPVCRLTDAALEMIANEAERIDLVLRHARESIVVEDNK